MRKKKGYSPSQIQERILMINREITKMYRNILDNIYKKSRKLVRVTARCKEDKKKAKVIEEMLNYKISKELDKTNES